MKKILLSLVVLTLFTISLAPAMADQSCGPVGGHEELEDYNGFDYMVNHATHCDNDNNVIVNVIANQDGTHNSGYVLVNENHNGAVDQDSTPIAGTEYVITVHTVRGRGNVSRNNR